MFVASHDRVIEEIVFEPFLSILLTCINLQPFRRIAPRKVAMCPQPTILIDAAIVLPFIKLDMSQTRPFPIMHVVISSMFRIKRIEQRTWHHNALLKVEQIQRIGTK